MPSNVSMKALLETGVHFGHRTRKWNPKMKPYIFTERNGIHIIDLQQTIVSLHQYYDYVRDRVAAGGTVLFVGTKRQAQEAIAREADRCHMPYVNQRWLGGTLTNWKTIRDRLETMKKYEKRRDTGGFDALTKKERLLMEREIEKLNLRLGGLRDMKRLPDVVIVIDVKRESTSVKEANTLGIPVLAVVDTNCDPDQIDYIIPGNDDAVRAIKLLLTALADAVIEGQAMRKSEASGDSAEVELATIDYDAIDIGMTGEEDDDQYLGASTLAKLRDADLFTEEE